MKKIIGIITILLSIHSVYAQINPNRNIPNQDLGKINRENTSQFKNAALTNILQSFSNYNYDRRDVKEIEHLKFCGFENQDPKIGKSEKLLLVLVEDRLFDRILGKYTVRDLNDRLSLYRQQLKKEGFRPIFINAKVYAENQHQDGLTLLALREFFKAVHMNYNLQGVIFIGSFPDAMLVRRYPQMWRHMEPINGQQYNVKEMPVANILNFDYQVVAARTELILGDLDGNWHNLYTKKRTKFNAIYALVDDLEFDLQNGGPSIMIESTNGEIKTDHFEFEDFFLIDDSQFDIVNRDPNNFKIRLSQRMKNPEISTKDRRQRNPIARPEIFISRINPRNIAREVNKKMGLDKNGKLLIDLNTRKPNIVEYKRSKGDIHKFLIRDARLERKILMEYLLRNINYRKNGSPDRHFRAISVHTDPGLGSATDMMNYLSKASNRFRNNKSYENAKLSDYIQFLKEPAVLKGIFAHSSAVDSHFEADGHIQDVYRKIGFSNGRIWRWKHQPVTGERFRYIPTLEGHKHTADVFLHRSLWESGTLSKKGATIYYHHGCDVMNPAEYRDLPYNHKYYAGVGGAQNAESVLFYLNGLAVVGRAKIFNDKPDGMTQALGNGKTLGESLEAYAQLCSEMNKPHGNICKKSYNWSIIGDWTLKIKKGKENTAPSPSRALPPLSTVYINRTNCSKIKEYNNRKISQFLTRLISGVTHNDDEQAILKILNCLPTARAKAVILKTGSKALQDDIQGPEYDQLQLVYQKCGIFNFSNFDDDAALTYINNSSRTTLSMLSILDVKILLRKLFDGHTGDDEEQAIIKLIDALDNDKVKRILRSKGFSKDDFDDEVDGAEWTSLKRVFARKGV